MLDLLDQLEASLASRQYYLSLMVALTIPDIAGALGAVDGLATGARYSAWYEQWARPQLNETIQLSLPSGIMDRSFSVENPLSGDACYRFRCSLLHQGTTVHPKSPFVRIIFIEPGATTNVVHYGTVNGALCIDLPSFCREVIRGARAWLASVQGSEPFESNFKRFVYRHPQGMAPYITGVPVIG